MQKLTRTLGNLVFLLKPYWRYGKVYTLGRILLSLFIAPLLALLDVMLVRKIIEAISLGKTLGETALTAAFIEAAWLALTLLRWSFLLLYERWKAVEVNAKINREIYSDAIKTDYRYFDNPNFYNDFTFAAGEYAAKCASALDLISILGGNISIVTAMTAYIATLGPWAVLIVAAGSGVCCAAQFGLSRLGIKRAADALPHERGMAYVHRVIYQTQYAADLKSTDINAAVFSAFDKGAKGKTGVYKKYSKSYWPLNVLSFSAYALTEFGVLTYLIVCAFTRSLGIGALTGLFSAALRLNGQLNQIVDNAGKALELSLYSEKIRGFFNLKSEIEPKTDGETPPDGAFSVELRGASFAYPNSPFALKNLNISIKPGEKIAIVGENGAGKSTLAKLLLRLYDLNGGEICYNNIKIRSFKPRELRRRIGIAFQQPNIYALTLRQNLSVYREVSDEKLLKILEKVRLSDKLVKSGATLGSEVTREFSENGLMFSGGEAQKLGIARILAGDFGLLLLDEPSSALDPLAEYELNRVLMSRENSATTIIIAHRLSSIREADCIYLIANGEVAERGTHAELMAAGGRYSEMFTKQAAGYGE
ncbi:MAG: ABC transporter ATP-binding protein/permease [Oscillospiraceae bacterium]|jgi:ATP-binding cassette subfamily B protein|nr:ABC transporter ATP-binding protein/permease [Oscillospiraceae bacterium]